MNIPSCYIPGYEKARKVNPELAANYIAHTTIGDPAADAAIADLEQLEPPQRAFFIQSVIDQDPHVLCDAPPRLRDLFELLETPPDWVSQDDFVPGVRMFHRNSPVVLAALAGGSLVEGFSTNIAKSFFITGRLRDAGVRRLKQNNRHMLELFMPGGMEREGDGWKLSVRLRLVHAQIRRLLTGSPEWDTAAWGMPVSAAHLGLAATVFSARLVHHIRSLGGRFNDDERASFIAVWRYAGWLMGIPETILFRREEDALRLFEIGGILEPEPEDESIVMANALVQSVPLVIGITDPDARRRMARYVHTVSRALIGDDLADRLKYPPTSTLGVLGWFRLQRRYEQTLSHLFSGTGQTHRFNQFTAMMEASAYDDSGISYRLPDHVFAELSSHW